MFRISFLLWLIVLAALNLVLLRYGEAVVQLSPKFPGLIGLMPLFDLFVLSLSLALTARFRIALVRRPVPGRTIDSIAVVSGAVLALGMLGCLLFPEVVLYLLDFLFSPFEKWIGVSSSAPETRGLLIGALLGAIVSGPSILLTLVLGFVHSRYTLEVTRQAVA